jgi:hypothetical protein
MRKVGAVIAGNAGEEDVVMAAFDDVDGVDLHIAEVTDRSLGRGRSRTEWLPGIEPLRPEPDRAGIGARQGHWLHFAAHMPRIAAPTSMRGEPGESSPIANGFTAGHMMSSKFPSMPREINRVRWA